MELTMAQLKNVFNALDSMTKMDLPGLLAYKVARNMKKLEQEARLFNDGFRKLQEEYADRDENGKIKEDEVGNVFFAKGREEDYRRDYLDFMETKIDANLLYITEAELVKVNSITPETLLALGPMLQVE